MVDSYYLYAISYDALKTLTPLREIRHIWHVFIMTILDDVNLSAKQY